MKRTLMPGVVLSSLLLCSWGFLVHRTTVQLAIYQLPKKLQPLFTKTKATW